MTKWFVKLADVFPEVLDILLLDSNLLMPFLNNILVILDLRVQPLQHQVELSTSIHVILEQWIRILMLVLVF